MRSPLQVFWAAKTASTSLAVVSLYDAPTAEICADAGCDALLVGDSLGNVILGYEGTQAVTMDEMLAHAGAVVRGVSRSKRELVPVVADLPFGSYATVELAVKNSARFIRAGVHAVKLEGAGTNALAAARTLTEMGVPVMGHLGFTPQQAYSHSAVVQGKTAGGADAIFQQAKTLQEAGCFAIVLEAVPMEVAASLTADLAVATIGIGSGPACNGQVLVWNDLAGLTPAPGYRLAKRFAEAHALLVGAASEYVREVHAGSFPTTAHGWPMPEDELRSWSSGRAAHASVAKEAAGS